MNDALVEAYLRHFREKRYEEVDELVRTEPERAWPRVVALVEEARDERELAYVAAGPLEDLICLHPAAVFERVQARSHQDAKFRRALNGVWGWNRMPPEELLRFAKIPGLEHLLTKEKK